MRFAQGMSRVCLVLIFGLFVLAGLFARTALAQEIVAKEQKVRLLYLPGKDLEILYVGEKGQWCAPRLDLVLISSQSQVLEDEALTDRQLAQLIIKLRRSCPQISQVGITGYSRIDQKRALLEGSYRAKDGWKFSKFKLADRMEQPVTQNRPAGAARTKNQPNRALTSDELRELQKRLSFLGFQIRKEDGRPSRETTQAIRGFLTRNGLSLPVRTDLDMLTAVRKISGAGRPTRAVKTRNSRRFNLSEYRDTGNRQGMNFGRLVSYWVVRNTPNLLNNKEILWRWLKAEGRDNQSPIQARSVALQRLYRQGTTFQKQDVLKSFRLLIENEVRRREDELKLPLKINVRLGADISGDYRAGTGFPISKVYRQGFGFSHRIYNRRNELNFYVSRLGRVLRLPLPKKAAVSYLPILNERNARKMAQLLQNKRRYSFEMRFYTIIRNVGFLTTGGQELQAATTLNRLSLEMLDRNDISGASKLVYNWKLISTNRGPNRQAAAKPTALQFAKWAGIKTLRDNLVLADWDKSGRGDFAAAASGKRRLTKLSRRGWAGFANLLNLQRNPSYLNNRKIALAVAATYLTQREKAELERGKNFLFASGRSRNSRNFNEFEYREFLARFQRGNYAARVERYFPPFPIPIVNIQAVTLGSYVFEKGAFPITFSRGTRERSVATWKPVLNLNMHNDFNLQRYPKQLSLSPENAKRLLRLFKQRNQDSRVVYLAIFAQMRSLGVRTKPGQYNVIANRVALYLDPQLKQRLAEFSMTELTSTASRGPRTSVSISQSKLGKLYQQRPVNEDQLARVVERLSDRKGFEGSYVRAMSEVIKVNELEKDRVFKEFLESLRFVAEPPKYWMNGWGTLGRYDSKREGFPIFDWQVGATTGSISSVRVNFRTEFADVKNVAFIKMERNRAAALLEKYPSRKFLLRVKVTPFEATWQFQEPEKDDPQQSRYPEATIGVNINEIYLLADPGSDQKNERALIAVKILPGKTKQVDSETEQVTE